MTITSTTQHATQRAPTRAPRHAGAQRGLLSRGCRPAATLLLVAACVAFLGLAVGPHVLDYRTATMLTASMAPDIEPGDIVVTTPEPVSQVQVGDVLSYHIPVGDHRVETHRVIEVVTDADGTLAVRTQGDANPAPDPWIATLDGDTVWQVQGSVPYVGDAIRLLRTPVVGTTLLYGVPAMLVLWALVGIWARPSAERGR